MQPGPHTAIAFDAEGGLLVTAVTGPEAGITRTVDGERQPGSPWPQAWLRTPVAAAAPRVARMLDDTTWELVDLQGRAVCSLRPPDGEVTSRLTVNAVSDDGTLAFGLASSHARKPATMIVWDGATGAVTASRPTLGTHPEAAFAGGAPLVARLAGDVLEVWDLQTDTVRAVAVGTGAAALAVDGTTACVGRGRTVGRTDLRTGEDLGAWSVPVRSVTALAIRGDRLVVGGGTSLVTLVAGVVTLKKKAPARLVAASPLGPVAGSDGVEIRVF